MGNNEIKVDYEQLLMLSETITTSVGDLETLNKTFFENASESILEDRSDYIDGLNQVFEIYSKKIDTNLIKTISNYAKAIGVVATKFKDLDDTLMKDEG